MQSKVRNSKEHQGCEDKYCRRNDHRQRRPISAALGLTGFFRRLPCHLRIFAWRVTKPVKDPACDAKHRTTDQDGAEDHHDDDPRMTDVSGRVLDPSLSQEGSEGR